MAAHKPFIDWLAGEGPGDALALLSIDLQGRSSATRWIALPIGVV
jgi:hypothetical protein